MTILFLAVLLLSLNLPHRVPTAGLVDPSWGAALIFFLANGFQFGRDVVFTFGPLGYLFTPIYFGSLVASRVLLEILTKGIFAWLMISFAWRLPVSIRVVFGLSTVFFLWCNDALLLALIVFVACYLLQDRAASTWCSIGAGLLLAFVSLIKFTCLVSSLLCVVLVGGYWCYKRRPMLAGLTAGAYGLGIPVWWCAAGQSLANLKPFLQWSLEISSGYEQAMFNTAPVIILVIGLVCALTVLTILALSVIGAKDKALGLTVGLIGLGSLFLAWKHGFVRGDQSHVLIFFASASLITFVVTAVRSNQSAYRLTYPILTILVLALSHLGFYLAQPEEYAQQPRIMLSKAARNASALAQFSKWRADLNTRLEKSRADCALPTIKRLVGTEPVDVFGHEQVYALLNDLNYRPRPVFQGYTAYTPRLIELNEDFYRGQTAPPFVLFKLQSFDHRFPPADDAGALKQILYNYEPIAREGNHLLWKTRDGTHESPHLDVIVTNAAQFDQKVSLPRESPALWLEIDWEISTLGKLKELLFRPSVVRIRVTSAAGHEAVYRLARPVAQAGFLIAPLLGSQDDLVEVIHHRAGPEQTPVAFQLEVPDAAKRFFLPRFRYRLYSLPEIPRYAGVTESEG